MKIIMNIDVLFYRTKIRKYEERLPQRIDELRQKSREIVDYISRSSDPRLTDFKQSNPHIFTTRPTEAPKEPDILVRDIMRFEGPPGRSSAPPPKNADFASQSGDPGPEMELPRVDEVDPKLKGLYRAACINLHPDKCGNTESSNERFSTIQSAFQKGDIHQILDIMTEAGIDVGPYIDKGIKAELKGLYLRLRSKADEFKANPTQRWRPDMTDDEKVDYITQTRLVFIL